MRWKRSKTSGPPQFGQRGPSSSPECDAGRSDATVPGCQFQIRFDVFQRFEDRGADVVEIDVRTATQETVMSNLLQTRGQHVLQEAVGCVSMHRSDANSSGRKTRKWCVKTHPASLIAVTTILQKVDSSATRKLVYRMSFDESVIVLTTQHGSASQLCNLLPLRGPVCKQTRLPEFRVRPGYWHSIH